MDYMMLLLGERNSKEDTVPWKNPLKGPVYYRLMFKPVDSKNQSPLIHVVPKSPPPPWCQTNKRKGVASPVSGHLSVRIPSTSVFRVQCFWKHICDINMSLLSYLFLVRPSLHGEALMDGSHLGMEAWDLATTSRPCSGLKAHLVRSINSSWHLFCDRIPICWGQLPQNLIAI